jgi:hypothetical protein
MLQKNFDTEYVRIMQARSEMTREGKRHSIIDEESEEEKPADIRVTEPTKVGARDKSLSSYDKTNGDASPALGFD